MHWKFSIENQPIDDDVRDSVSFANFVNTTTYLGTYLLNSLVSYLITWSEQKSRNASV